MSFSRFKTALALCVLAAGCVPCLCAQEKPAKFDPALTRVLVEGTASPVEVIAAMAAEQEMLAEATDRAALGDIAGSWALLVADFDEQPGKSGLRSDRIGWRAATVTGFLRNQNRLAESFALARLALMHSWCRAGGDEVRYWAAVVALDGTHDRKAALQWLGSARSDESPRLKDIRGRLEKIDNAFRTRG